ncbi:MULTISPECIES: phosphoenolpyruvate synthase [unclassified Wenzhouxiangella]|uniref:phosphoenolpyruvate synthase n=1 Tax=unclassified Wenzhouxiangella TaxID=2613841 RepID=UPI000E32BE2D|nr:MULTISPECIES: phosphoenolpyruvate synthase [unclassified Wenzhouxiangella]RFF28675.1 phosphoenolpyruvate synthase [Wenzhouxiangella sp. 15181]RFP70268.1 phosphoenolpyruvate synthase [Wenzhouxiangella sp. 15190]
MSEYILWLDELGMGDLDQVGGKNASLGEMIKHLSDLGVSVPGGFATTADAFRKFLEQSGLAERIGETLETLDADDTRALAKAGSEIRQWIMDTPLPEDLEQGIRDAYVQMQERYGGDLAVAVRSSATAEDLPDASFAGQQETFLNVCGIDAVLEKIHAVFASLYNDRAIAYRVHQGFAHADVALSAGIQLMVRAGTGAAGVLFTLDTESGYRNVVFITSSYGLGESVVQGAVNPDEFYLFKPNLRADKPAVLRRSIGTKASRMIYGSGDGGGVHTEDTPEADRLKFSISDAEATELAKMALTIEDHYGRPMDIEWGKDGETGELFILQARPETVKSRAGQSMERFRLESTGSILAEGRAIGQRIGQGKARVIESLDEIHEVEEGDVLITDMTDPDWEPVMKRAAAIVTNRGGRTCHAAIIARELAIPAVVGCGDATERVPHATEVTVACSEGDTGRIYDGKLEFSVSEDSLDDMPEPPLKIMMNVANPDRSFDFALIPNHGIGLARLEFIINRMIGIHPLALLDYDGQSDEVKAEIDRRTAGYDDPVSFYVDKLAEGIATIAAPFGPNPVIVRLSDFKSNEYANLIGGERYEPDEENPMIGWRGASRYVDENFQPAFELECRAMKKVREEMGLDHVWAMVPFVRTVGEARDVVAVMDKFGLKRGENGLKIIMMCELPSNALSAEAFLEHFDGFSIGSNDMTQLTLGLDRDSGLVAHRFDERDPAVKAMLAMAIEACRKQDKYIGICGQGPSDYPDLAEWLMDQGIESMSLNPDTVVDTWRNLAQHRG